MAEASAAAQRPPAGGALARARAAARGALVRLGYAALRAGFNPRPELAARFYQEAFLRDLLRRLKVNVVIDVGAHHGWFGRHLRMAGYDGWIVSVEPLHENFAALSDHARGDPRWTLVNCALGREPGTQRFNVIREQGLTTFSSFLTPHSHTVEGHEQVEVQRLDALAGTVLATVPDPRVFLKVDTQGYDLEVIRGAEGCLDLIAGLQAELAVHPLYEGMPHHLEVMAYLEQRGFSLMDLVVIHRTDRGSVLEYDCIMARLDRLARLPGQDEWQRT